MNKTIYLKEEDVATWEEAKRVAGGTISTVIVQGLKLWLENQPFCVPCDKTLKDGEMFCPTCGTLRVVRKRVDG